MNSRVRLGTVHTVGLNAFEAKMLEVQASVGTGAACVRGRWRCGRIGAGGTRSYSVGNHQLRVQVSRRRLTVALSPADIPKSGSGFDLAIAVAILVSTGEAAPHRLPRTVVMGSWLSTGGCVRSGASCRP